MRNKRCFFAKNFEFCQSGEISSNLVTLEHHYVTSLYILHKLRDCAIVIFLVTMQNIPSPGNDVLVIPVILSDIKFYI